MQEKPLEADKKIFRILQENRIRFATENKQEKADMDFAAEMNGKTSMIALAKRVFTWWGYREISIFLLSKITRQIGTDAIAVSRAAMQQAN